MSLRLIIVSVIGCLEWWLALARQSAHTKNRRNLVAVIVGCEVALGLFVVSEFIGGETNWWVAGAYIWGSMMGARFAR
uniref:Uncharacterized protein n=1 Tax=viral metagenome TaxID=1070528 RepID=A0A6M3LAF9_9ZZZZ